MSGATSYKIEVDTAQSFNSPVISAPLSDTLYAPQVDLELKKYYWRASSSHNLAEFSPMDSIVIIASVDKKAVKVPKPYTELIISPNPFSTAVSIDCRSESKSMYSISVYNIDGTFINQLSKDTYGNQPVIWDGTNSKNQKVPAGIYLVKIHQGNKIINRKAVLLR